MRRRRLDGKVVLITGAARGIGEQSARLAAQRGARVALVGLEPERLRALAEELGPRHAWFEADVTDQASLDRAVAGTVERLGGIDAVVANAGVANNSTVAVSPVDVVARTIEVNLLGVVRTIGATLPHLTARRGYVLIVSSAAAFTVLPGMAAYCASKAGVEQFGNALRLEVAHKGVQVGTIHPSWIDTDLVRDQKDDSPTFSRSLEELPWPLNQTTTVAACAEAVVDAIERRRRKVYVPRTIAIVQALRALVMSPLVELAIKRRARTMVPALEAEVQALGRFWGSSSAGLGAPRDATAARAEPAAPAEGAATRS